MSDHPDSDLKVLRELAELAPVDVPGDVGERVRRRAHRELEEASAPGGTSWVTLATRAWTRVGLPAALAVTVVAYLSWAVTSASAVYR
jgi:hypothetical protein